MYICMKIGVLIKWIFIIRVLKLGNKGLNPFNIDTIIKNGFYQFNFRGNDNESN